MDAGHWSIKIAHPEHVVLRWAKIAVYQSVFYLSKKIILWLALLFHLLQRYLDLSINVTYCPHQCFSRNRQFNKHFLCPREITLEQQVEDGWKLCLAQLLAQLQYINKLSIQWQQNCMSMWHILIQFCCHCIEITSILYTDRYTDGQTDRLVPIYHQNDLSCRVIKMLVTCIFSYSHNFFKPPFPLIEKAQDNAVKG